MLPVYTAGTEPYVVGSAKLWRCDAFFFFFHHFLACHTLHGKKGRRQFLGQGSFEKSLYLGKCHHKWRFNSETKDWNLSNLHWLQTRALNSKVSASAARASVHWHNLNCNIVSLTPHVCSLTQSSLLSYLSQTLLSSPRFPDACESPSKWPIW